MKFMKRRISYGNTVGWEIPKSPLFMSMMYNTHRIIDENKKYV